MTTHWALPRYGQYALSMPGLIPFSESAGFILRPGTGDDDLDLPFYITAHEVAHLWWGQQVAGADGQGVRWINEGLANYSALSVAQGAGRESLRLGGADQSDRKARRRDQPVLGRVSGVDAWAPTASYVPPRSFAVPIPTRFPPSSDARPGSAGPRRLPVSHRPCRRRHTDVTRLPDRLLA